MEVLPIGDFLDRHKSESEDKILEAASVIRFQEWQDVLKPEFKEKFGIDPSNNKEISNKVLEQTRNRYENNPEGQIIAHIPKYGVVGSIFSLIVNSKTKDFSDHIFRNYDTLTDKNHYFTTHNPKGNTIVCPEVSAAHVKINDKKVKIGSNLVKEALFFAYKNNLKAIAYSRPSSFQRFIEDYEGDDKSIQNYIKLRKKGICSQFFDAIDFHMKADARIGRIIENGRPADSESEGYNVIMIYLKKVIKQHGRELEGLYLKAYL
jgi:hypothetical protein